MSLPTFARRLWDRYRPLAPAVYWIVTIIGAVWCLLIVYGFVGYGLCGNTGTVHCDAYSSWAADDTPYTWEINLEYRYSPAFLWLIRPLQLLPFDVFLGIWAVAHIAGFIWLRAGWMLIVPGVNEDVLRGNITIFLAVAVVLALRHSGGWWSVALLTKVTPAVGMVWHVVRREWRALATGLGVTAAIVAVGWIIDAELWAAWVDSLLNAGETYEIGHPLGPLWLRLVLAGGVTAYAAWSDRAWLVPLAMIVAVPGLWPYNLGFVAAIPRLARPEGTA